MSIIDVRERITDNWDNYQKKLHSSDSSIFCDPLDITKATISILDISVGAHYYNSSMKKLDVPECGIMVKNGEFVVIETLELIAIPNNILGVVSGKGTFIVRGIFISGGKIEPGFKDRLKIGFLNMSSEPLLIKSKTAFAACFFINTETTISIQPLEYEKSPNLPSVKKHTKMLRSNWLNSNIYNIITVLTALGALIVSIVKG